MVGSYIAQQLAVAGYSVIVFEEHERLGEATCCTGIIGKKCFDSFPIAHGIALKEASSAKFFAPSGNSLRLWKEGVQAYIIDRASLDVELARRAQEAGAYYLLGSQVKDIIVADDRVEIKPQGGFEARAVVIASGFGSRLPQRLGLGEIEDFAIGAQAEVMTGGIDEVEVYFGRGVAPGFFAWLVPTSQHKALAGLLTRRPPGSYLKDFLSTLYTRGTIASPEGEISYGWIPLKPLPRTYGERIMVVGDAAGQVKPTTGGGIYYGLLCADIVVDTLNQAFATNDFSAKKLSRYEWGWKKRLSRELRIGHYARRFFELLSDEQIDHLFDIMQSGDLYRSLLESEDFSFDWHGELILQGLRQEAMRNAIEIMRIPKQLKELLFRQH